MSSQMEERRAAVLLAHGAGGGGVERQLPLVQIPRAAQK